ncbi:protein-disulfide reductase DsbD family protein [Oceanimonas sp. CHS3-5]|uniref:protein-disulfide reductase DsbD domain-containing protein n=1 Tax=Oceanimonas sp. CHS3-5 TaxID=3068186 RepID=UPI00273D7558|nr:protein-disulfide reductase DsbD domain-containing protein [Oceanimonas sp. CHS3-5]MDP5293775.1 protein-disulfide reductase DsbD family protein [Oceanimonas sp. CHS3-5]
MKPALLTAALAGLLLMLTPLVLEQFGSSSPPGNRVLPVEQAFVIDHRRDGDILTVNITIAPEAYLYRHKLAAEGHHVELNAWQPPEGEAHEDEYFGKSQVYRNQVELRLPLRHAGPDARVMLDYQGCTTGLCYPPQRVELVLP